MQEVSLHRVPLPRHFEPFELPPPCSAQSLLRDEFIIGPAVQQGFLVELGERQPASPCRREAAYCTTAVPIQFLEVFERAAVPTQQSGSLDVVSIPQERVSLDLEILPVLPPLRSNSLKWNE